VAPTAAVRGGGLDLPALRRSGRVFGALRARCGSRRPIFCTHRQRGQLLPRASCACPGPRISVGDGYQGKPSAEKIVSHGKPQRYRPYSERGRQSRRREHHEALPTQVLPLWCCRRECRCHRFFELVGNGCGDVVPYGVSGPSNGNERKQKDSGPGCALRTLLCLNHPVTPCAPWRASDA
jgi:hypothetical protein